MLSLDVVMSYMLSGNTYPWVHTLNLSLVDVSVCDKVLACSYLTVFGRPDSCQIVARSMTLKQHAPRILKDESAWVCVGS